MGARSRAPCKRPQEQLQWEELPSPSLAAPSTSPKQDVVSLMGCARLAAPVCAELHQKGARCSAAGDTQGHSEREGAQPSPSSKRLFCVAVTSETAEFLALASWHAEVKQMAASTRELPLVHGQRKLCMRGTRLSPLQFCSAALTELSCQTQPQPGAAQSQCQAGSQDTMWADGATRELSLQITSRVSSVAEGGGP